MVAVQRTIKCGIDSKDGQADTHSLDEVHGWRERERERRERREREREDGVNRKGDEMTRERERNKDQFFSQAYQ